MEGFEASVEFVGFSEGGGNIRALAIAPSNPNIIYAGSSVGGGLAATAFEQTLKGGIFKTTNGGQSWTAASNGLSDVPVVSLAVDPSNPNTVYAAIYTNGVYKTVDGGQSWGNTGLTSPFAQLVALDPSNSSTVYVGTNSPEGWFKSTNGGQSWTALPDCSPANSNFVYVVSLAFDPTNASTIYVGTSPINGASGFFKSTDGGQSWTLTNAGLVEPPVGGGISISAITIDPTKLIQPTRRFSISLAEIAEASSRALMEVSLGLSWHFALA